MIELTLKHSPHHYQRPRLSRGNVYVPHRKAKELTKLVLRSMYKDKMLDEGFSVDFDFVFTRPRSRKNASVHTSAPDLDNIIKFYLDAGTDVLWKDDRLCVAINARKSYGEQACIKMTVKKVSEDAPC